MANIFYLRNNDDLTAAHTRLGITGSTAMFGTNTANWYAVDNDGTITASKGTGEEDTVYLTAAAVGINNSRAAPGDDTPFSAGGGADEYIITKAFVDGLKAAPSGTTTNIVIHDEGLSRNLVTFETGVTITHAVKNFSTQVVYDQLFIGFLTGGTASQLSITGGDGLGRNDNWARFKLGASDEDFDVDTFLREVGPIGNNGALNEAFTVPAVNAAPALADIDPLTYEDSTADDTFQVINGTFSAPDADGDTVTYSVAEAEALTPGGDFTHEVSGDYGTLQYNEGSGAWRFTPDDLAIEILEEGDMESDTFTVTATDTNGGVSAAKNLVINVIGADDDNLPAVITDLQVDSGVSASVTIHGVKFTAMPGAPTPTRGIKIAKTESYAPSLPDVILTAADAYTILLVQTGRTMVTPQNLIDAWNGATRKGDNTGSTESAQEAQDRRDLRLEIITVAEAAGDAPDALSSTKLAEDYGTPTPFNPAGNAVTRDLAVTLVYDSNGALDDDHADYDTAANGSIRIREVDGFTKTDTTNLTATATYGTVALAADSNNSQGADAARFDWIYTLNPGDPQTATLAEGMFKDTVSITLTDNAGGTTTHGIDIAIEVMGTAAWLANDAPADTRFNEAPTPPATEVDKAVALAWGGTHETAASGTLTITDTDGVASISHNGAMAQYGTFTFDEATGAWTYTLDPSNPLTTILTAGTYMETITFTVTDDTGNKAIQPQPLVITITVTGTPPNTPPTITLVTTLTVAEDASHTFADTHFGFTEGDTGDTLKSVVIVSLPEKGTLTRVNASTSEVTAVTAGQVIAVTDIPELRYNPEDAFAPGAPASATFDYAVIDSDDIRSANATLTIEVTGVDDDEATAIGLSATSGTVPSNFITTTARKLADIEITDPDGGEAGMLELAVPGSPTTDADARFALAPDNSALMLVAGATLAENDNVSVRVQLVNTPSVGVDYTLTVGGQNAIPTAKPATGLQVAEDRSLILTPGNFGFADGDDTPSDSGNSFASVTIVTLPMAGTMTAGTLTLDGVVLTADNLAMLGTIPVADITAGKLAYNPPDSFATNTLITFTYSVNDGFHESTDAVDGNGDAIPAASMGITVIADDDRGTGIELANVVQTLPANAKIADGDIKVADITLIDDPDGVTPGSLEAVMGSAASTQFKIVGTELFLIMGTTIAENDVLEVRVQVVGSSPSIGADYTLMIGAENTPPTAIDKSVDVDENVPYTFKVADFGFDDSNTSDALASVTIVTLPDSGTLTLDGTAVSENDTITATDIVAGNLVYTPATGLTEDTDTTFTYRVSDGLNESTNTATMSIAVTLAPDVPLKLVIDDDITFDGGAFVFTRRQLDANEPDTGADGLTYTLTAAPDFADDPNAALQLYNTTSEEWEAIPTDGTFTQAQVDNGHVRLNAAGDGTISVRVSDGTNSIPAVGTDARVITFTARVIEELPPSTEVGGAQDINFDTGSDAEKATPRTLKAGVGKTTITLTSGNDKVDAGLGDDVINLTPGEDAADENIVIYHFATEGGNTIAWSGGDSITGFSPGKDKLVLNNIGGGNTPFIDGLGSGFIATLTTAYSGSGGRENITSYSVTGVEIHFAQAVLLPGGVLGGSVLSVKFNASIGWGTFNQTYLASGSFNDDTLLFNDNEAGEMALAGILGLRDADASDQVSIARSVAIGDGEANTIDLTDAMNSAGGGEAEQRGAWVVFGGGGDDTITLRADTPPPASVTPPPPDGRNAACGGKRGHLSPYH